MKQINYFQYISDGVNLIMENESFISFDSKLLIKNNYVDFKISKSMFYYDTTINKKDYLTKFIFYNDKTIGVWSNDDKHYLKIKYEEDDLFDILKGITSDDNISHLIIKMKNIYLKDIKNNNKIDYYQINKNVIDKVINGN